MRWSRASNRDDGLVQLIHRAQQSQRSREGTGATFTRAHEKRGSHAVSAASFYVPALPAASSSAISIPSMYSGHLPATYHLDGSSEDSQPDDAVSDAHLFFLLVQSLHVADRQKLVIWFNGGPGCSSFDGALLEIGPLTVQGTGSNTVLHDNPGKWNEYANILFIDQPAGTGYSYINSGQPVRELGPAAEQVVNFLANFYTVFPEYQRIDTYLAGESYAGTTIPYLARAIGASKAMPNIFKGMLIGNGWFSPKEQYPGYVEYAEQRGFLKNKGSKPVKEVSRLLRLCERDLNSTIGFNHVLVSSCETLIDAVMTAGRSTIDTKKYCIGEYDVRPTSFCGEYPPGLQYAMPYLQRSDVLEAFHAQGKSSPWQQCNNTVGSQMWSPKSLPSINLFPELLEIMPILLFAGDSDLMCNWIGIEQSIRHLTWRGSTGFSPNATSKEWYVNGTLAGTWQEERNLTWVIVKDAGHMVPINKPLEAHDILLRFIGVDPLNAAGAGSKVPSTIGNESGGVLGKVSPEGDTLDSVAEDLKKESAAADKAASDAVDKAGEDGQPIDKERELLYGPRRSAVLLLIIVTVCLTIYAFLRWRVRQRRRRKGWAADNLDRKRHNVIGQSDSAMRLNMLSKSPTSRQLRQFRGSSIEPITGSRAPSLATVDTSYDQVASLQGTSPKISSGTEDRERRA